jgi:hypothetical protein
MFSHGLSAWRIARRASVTLVFAELTHAPAGSDATAYS